MKLRQFAVVSALITNSCGIPDAFAEPDYYKQFCNQLSGSTRLDLQRTRNVSIPVSTVDYTIDMGQKSACFEFGGLPNFTEVIPSHICVDFIDNEADPTIIVLFSSGYKEDVSDTYSPEALRPWAEAKYHECSLKFGPPV